MRNWLRIWLGYVMACIAAAVALAGLAYTPRSFKQAPFKILETLTISVGLAPYVAIGIAIVAFIPALLVIRYAETRRIREWLFYLGVSTITGLASYVLAHLFGSVPASGGATAYAALAFAGAGLTFGLVYWAFAGRLAGGSAFDPNRPLPEIARNTRRTIR